MAARFAIFAHDRSERWILVPGVASTRLVEIRNDADQEVECHLRVERPASASCSPTTLTIPPHHARTVEIIFLATWAPEDTTALTLSLRNAQGDQLATFSHEIVAADSSDCGIGIDLREPILVGDRLAGFTLWFSITSRSATPRRFEIDFVPHPSLHFPERKTITLAPGEATAFEVPVEWNRAVRDIHWWNHPPVLEAFAPVSRGRRTAALSWDVIERRLSKYLTDDDRVAKVIPTETPQRSRPDLTSKTAQQLKHAELMELKQLEQAVVGVAHVRPQTTSGERAASRMSLRRIPFASIAITSVAIVAIATGALLFSRPASPGHNPGPVRVTPPVLTQPYLTQAKAHVAHRAGDRVAKPAWTTIAQTGSSAVAGAGTSRERSGSIAGSTSRAKTLAVGANQDSQAQLVDRNAIVSLSGVDAEYASGGRAVSVTWAGSSQASATVQILDSNGRIIASRFVRGAGSTATLHVPRGFRPTSVQVIAKGFHGERSVQSAALATGG